MMKRRVLTEHLERATSKPRRAPRLVRGTRSLVNCNHLATSDTKLKSETMAANIERRNEHRKQRAAQTFLRNQLLGTLRGIALRAASIYLPATSTAAPTGKWDAGKDYRRINDCQSEWIGWKAKCCNGPAIAVPIGCNHRLCPYCAAGRLEHYRGPARKMLEAMKNPCFLTLTIPNSPTLTPKTFSQIRGWWKEFRRSNAMVGTGGVYSIEVTYNRTEKTWHPHLHILFDSPFKLSLSPREFINLKRRLEFSWTRITSPATRKAYKGSNFDGWNADARMQEKGSEWNRTHRRVVDLRTVKPGSGAVYEVIKYISKTNRFLDNAEAVEGYLRAVRGVRVIQTFGTSYNIKFDDQSEPQTYMKCECGVNDFERVGMFGLTSVYQAENGGWYLKQTHQHRQRCRSGPS